MKYPFLLHEFLFCQITGDRHFTTLDKAPGNNFHMYYMYARDCSNTLGLVYRLPVVIISFLQISQGRGGSCVANWSERDFMKYIL